MTLVRTNPPTPTISLAATGDTSAAQTLTITNWSDYYAPSTWARVVDSGGSEATAPSAVTDNDDGTLTVPMPAGAGTYTVEVKVQEFGKLASNAATADIVLSAPPSYRYYRLTGFAGIGPGEDTAIQRWRLFDAVSGGGTQYPPTMSNNTTPSPYVASASFEYNASYEAWKAFDGLSYTMWWLLGRTPAQHLTDWIQIDLGASVTILSAWVDFSDTEQDSVTFQGSTDALSWTTISTTATPTQEVWIL